MLRKIGYFLYTVNNLIGLTRSAFLVGYLEGGYPQLAQFVSLSKGSRVDPVCQLLQEAAIRRVAGTDPAARGRFATKSAFRQLAGEPQ